MARGKRPRRSTATGPTLETTADLFDAAKNVKTILVGVAAFLPAGANEYLLHLGQGIVASMLVTVPLTIAVAVATAGLLLRGESAEWHYASSLGVLVAGNLLGFSTGTHGLADWKAGGVAGFVFTLVLGYGRAYGYLAYVAPAVIGTAMGWAWRRIRDGGRR